MVFVAEALADLWGFTRVRGADLEVDDATGLFTGRVSRHCEPEDKVTFVAEQCQRLGVGLDQVVAIGDGRSDLPLFHSVGFSVVAPPSPRGQVRLTLPALRSTPHPRHEQPHPPLSTASPF